MRRALVVGALVAAAVFAGAMAAGGDEKPAQPSEKAAAPADRAASPDGREVFARMGCGSCHRLAAAGATGRVGPSLDERLPNHTRASLRSKILAPSSGSGFSMMPEDFAKRMDASELDALVDFLLAAGRRG